MLDKNSDLVKSFYDLFNTHNTKSDIVYHKKKGSDIKAGIVNVIVSINKQREECLDKIKAESEHLEYSPDVEPYMASEYRHLIGMIPRTFSYDMLYHGEKYVRTDRGIEEKAIRKPSDEQRQEMQEYNQYVEKYLESSIARIKLETLKRNIEENKNYNLSIDQLSILGL